MKTFGIIGTAGRREDFNKLNIQVFSWMKKQAREVINSIRKRDNIRHIGLVSGGAAWADHVAVSLFLDNFAEELILHLPAPFFDEYDEGASSGPTANFYHRRFSDKCFLDTEISMEELNRALACDHTHVTISNNFFERNSKVAHDSDFLLAFSFGQGASLKDGGSLDTMQKFILAKGSDFTWHINLADKKVYHPVIL